MELDLIGDQELLRDTAAKFMDASCPLDVVRQLSATDTGLPANYMHDAAELGWFSLLVPANDGGGSVSGDGLRDAAILAEERGRRLQPGPFVPMNVVASALAARGSADQKAKVLPAILNGEALATWAAADGAGAWPPGTGLRHHRPEAGSSFRGAPDWPRTPRWLIGSWWLRAALLASTSSWFPPPPPASP